MRAKSIAAAVLIALTSLAFAPGGQAQRHLAADPCAGAYLTLSVSNQAGARAGAVSLVEYATVVQAQQLRAAWGTPCVQFGAGGWPVALTFGAANTISGHHDFTGGIPSATIGTGGLSYTIWARAFTHEVAEMLVNPSLDRRWRYGRVEVCDAVEDLTYSIAGVQVSDFVTPSYFYGGAGPFDWMHRLGAAFSL